MADNRDELLARFCAEQALEKLGSDVIALDLREISSVADYFVIGGDWGEEPKRVDTVPVARARIACVYEATVFAGDETQAFAEGYLSIALSPRGKIKARSVEKIGDGEYKDVLGLCKLANREEIKEKGFSLTPGAYVGVEEVKDDGVDFSARMKEIHKELLSLQAQSNDLMSTISKNIKELGL